MKQIKIIYDREFESYFRTLYGFVLTAFILLVAGIYFSVNALRNSYAAFEISVSNMTFIYLIVIPVLTMRVFAEERRQKTEQLMYSLPVKMHQVVLGKFFALCVTLALPLSVTAIYPILMQFFGRVDLKAAYCALFGFWLLGCTLCSIGMFLSSLTDNQAVSACLSFIAMLLLFFVATLAGLLPPSLEKLAAFFRLISPFDRYYSFLSGIFDLRSLVYMLALSALFIVLTAMVLEGRRSEKKGIFYSCVLLLSILIIAFSDILIGRLPQTVTQLPLNSVGVTDFSAETKRIAEGLDEDVTIYWITRDGKEDNYIEQTLSAFDALSDKLRVVKVDPIRQPKFSRKYTNKTVNENSLVVESGTFAKYIDYTEIYQNPNAENRYSTDFYAEALIGGALARAGADTAPKIYLLSGHGEEALSDTFTDGVKNANMSLAKLDLLSKGEIPADCSCLFVSSTPTDITENEAEIIIKYLKRGGKLLLFSTYLDEKTSNWNAVLSRYGLGAQKGVIIEGNSNHIVANYPYYLLPDLQAHAITADLRSAGQRVIIPLTQALDVNAVIPEDASFDALLVSSDAAYAKADGFSMSTTEREDGDISGKFVLAAALTKDEGDAVSRLVWFPTSYMLADSVNKSVSGGNLQLLVSSLSWLTDHAAAANVPPKSIGGGRLTVPSSYANLLSPVMIALIPLLFIVYGVSVTVRRKRR